MIAQLSRATTLLLLVAITALTACSIAPVKAPLEEEARRAAVRNIDKWQLRGRIAYRGADGEGGQASLRWAQQFNTSELRIAGPFGAGAYELVVEPAQVIVRDGTGERTARYSGPAATEQFLAAQLGWAFPADAVRFWMLGMLDPAAPGSEVFAADGRPASLQQHGWAIEYQRFADFDGLALPVKLQIENPRARLRVVVTDWVLTR